MTAAPGFGVFQIPAEETAQAVAAAIEAGYRHIDTAQSYANEEAVGEGIRRSGLDRSELFVTTKVWLDNYGRGTTFASVEASLERLGLDYVDEFLLHQPFSDVFRAWHDLEEAHRQGLACRIGVSNFTPAQVTLRWLLQRGITPLAKSVRPERMSQNLDVQDFELTAQDMEAISTLEGGNSLFFDHQSLAAIDLMVSLVKQRRQ